MNKLENANGMRKKLIMLGSLYLQKKNKQNNKYWHS